eukprot:815435_1
MIEIDIEIMKKMKKESQDGNQKNKNIPCRFFHSKRGCRKGDNCMFLHDVTGGVYGGGLSLPEIGICKTDSITLDNDNGSFGDGNGDGDKDMRYEGIKVIDNAIPSGNDNGNDNDNDNDNEMEMDIDEEIDELATQIRAKASISFPAKISFGRRRRV